MPVHTVVIQGLIALGRLCEKTIYKIAAIIIVACYVAVTLYMQSQHFSSRDPQPVLHTLPQKAQSIASHITVGMHINSFPSFSFTKNDFIVDGIVWFKFPRGSQSLSTIESFAIYNSIALERGDLIYKSQPIISLAGNDVQVCYHIQANFKADLNHSNFPLAQRTLTIMIENKNVSPYQLYFDTNERNLTINPNHLLFSWSPIKTHAYAGYYKAPLQTTAVDAADDNTALINYPAAALCVIFKSTGIRDLISFYFPMFVLFFIALFCLLIEITDPSRLSYVASAIPILVLFRMVIDAGSPEVGLATHLDIIYYLLVILSMLILFFQTYVILTIQHFKKHALQDEIFNKHELQCLNDSVFMLIIILLAAGLTYTWFR